MDRIGRIKPGHLPCENSGSIDLCSKRKKETNITVNKMKTYLGAQSIPEFSALEKAEQKEILGTVAKKSVKHICCRNPDYPEYPCE